VGAVQDTETYHWVDYTVPSRLRTQRERIRFTDWLLTPDILEARSKTRREYSQTGYNHKEYNLQQLCLIAYSTANNRTIDSIVLEVDIDSLSIVTCRLVIQVNGYTNKGKYLRALQYPRARGLHKGTTKEVARCRWV